MASATRPPSSRATASASNMKAAVSQGRPLPSRSNPPPTRLRTVREASQDSFAGPVSQDLEREFLATSKTFEIPLSELGGDSQDSAAALATDPDPDHSSSSRADMFTVPPRERHAVRTPAYPRSPFEHGKVLVAATPSNSGSSQSQPSQSSQQPGLDPELFGTRQPMDFSYDEEPHVGDVDARSEASSHSAPSSSYERLLAGEPEPDELVHKTIEYQATQPSTQIEEADSHDDDMAVNAEDLSTGQRAEWGTGTHGNTHTTTSDPRYASMPSDNSSVAPRSILSLVDQKKKWRVSKYKEPVIAPPDNASAKVDEGRDIGPETQPSFEDGAEGTGGDTVGFRRQARHEVAWPVRSRPLPPSNDTVDIVPDSEPPRCEHEELTLSPELGESTVTQPASPRKSPSKRNARQFTSSGHSGEVVPDSLLGNDDDEDDDTPLAALAPRRSHVKNTSRSKAKPRSTGRRPLEMIPSTPIAKVNIYSRLFCLV
jgi:hypothetical protein